MNRYRRIEITAFQKRVTVVSGEWTIETSANVADSANNAASRESIEPESAEGQRILTEAIRMLEEKLGISAPCQLKSARHGQTGPTPEQSKQSK